MQRNLRTSEQIAKRNLAASKRRTLLATRRKKWLANSGAIPKLALWKSFENKFQSSLAKHGIKAVFNHSTLQFSLHIRNERAAVLTLRTTVTPELGKAYAIIDELQGKEGHRLHSVSAANDSKWNVVVGKAVVAAAYKAGYSGVMISDPNVIARHAQKNMPFSHARVEPYKKIVDAWLNKKIEKIYSRTSKHATLKKKSEQIAQVKILAKRRLQKMIDTQLRPQLSAEIKRVYQDIITNCDFTKHEGEYYVREFP